VTEDGSQYRFSWESGHEGQAAHMPDGAWVFVNGGGLPCEVALRFHRHVDGRYVFTGIVIADPLPAPLEVTTQLLRQIRLGEIQAALFGPGGLLGDFDPARPPLHGETPSPEVTRWLADLSAAHGQLADGPSRGPGDAALRDFARTYQLELARQPWRAMSAAAKAHSISRATAHRWAAACRRLGYLPGIPGEEPSS
jgi:hypothetical protein